MSPSPFRRPNSVSQPTLRLAMFHHAGGSATMYLPMSEELPADWDLLLFDMPGRGTNQRRSEPASMNHLLAEVAADIDPWLDAPIALVGHSLGAVIASEMGRYLCARGTPPVWVGVSGRVAPDYGPRPTGHLHRLDDETLLDELSGMGAMDRERLTAIPNLRDHFLRTARSDLRLVESYIEPPDRNALTCPLTVFASTDDEWAPLAGMPGWRRETTHSFRQREFSGGHFYFLGERFAEFAQCVVAEAGRNLHLPQE
ncbi:thioesterase II family protein [Salinactinospora qingdaonensis]|uniref:Alpha/beta fold hydrolase n=1 Tax=Salinactinospora qingdaonensis TaxID=702744 RepID=A0ABP7EUP8_9ACTN